MLPAVSPTSEPDSHGMSLVADGSPDDAADIAHSLFLLRLQSILRAEIPASDTRPRRRGLAKMQMGCWWCRPGRNSEELLTFLAHAPHTSAGVATCSLPFCGTPTFKAGQEEDQILDH